MRYLKSIPLHLFLEPNNAYIPQKHHMENTSQMKSKTNLVKESSNSEIPPVIVSLLSLFLIIKKKTPSERL